MLWPGDNVGHPYKGCADKTLWEEDFLLLLYHRAQSFRLARYVTARLLTPWGNTLYRWVAYGDLKL